MVIKGTHHVTKGTFGYQNGQEGNVLFVTWTIEKKSSSYPIF